jgi:phytanoyl-CoA hydroxylase
LTRSQLDAFDRDGYVVVEEVFQPERDLDPLLAEYDQVLDRLARELHASGAVSETYAGLPFGERLTRIYAESGKVFAQYFDFSLPRGATEDTPFWTGPAVFDLLRHDGLLDAIESLIGGEIYSNPVQHVRLKPPEQLVPIDPVSGRPQLGATPWHQDNSVVTEDADRTETITAWFPLVDVTAEMGSLVVVPGSHKGGLLAHCPSKGPGGLHVPSRFFRPEDGVAVPMQRGSVLLMHRRTLHSSLPNSSDTVRFSLDLRYHPVGQPTGRSALPGFVARSRSRPETELRDPAIWTELWLEARRALAQGVPPKFNRWDANSPVCA